MKVKSAKTGTLKVGLFILTVWNCMKSKWIYRSIYFAKGKNDINNIFDQIKCKMNIPLGTYRKGKSY